MKMLKWGNKVIWKILAILMGFFLAMVVLIPSAVAVSESDGFSSSTTMYVPDSYPTIQAAVDAALPGDTIIVRDGTYRGNMDVNKRLTIKSENGPVNCIVEAEDRNDQVIEVNAGHVNISGFTVTGAYYSNAGICLHHADHCCISNNYCSNNLAGIYLVHSNNNSISNNNCSNCLAAIICFINSNRNRIESNYCSNGLMGIILGRSSTNTLVANNFIGNGIGIRGYSLSAYTDEIDETPYSSRIYLNNFVNNIANVRYLYHNTWNSTETITYTYNGSSYANYLGNYWDGYTGNDTNNDGIGDTPYRINSENDNYPLMQPWENYFVEENGAETENEITKKFAFSSYYQPIEISVNLSVPLYQLPLNLSNVTNIEDITAKLRLNETEEELLGSNGFVIMDYGQEDDIVAPYKDMKDRGVPIFVTTDTLLHLYHIQFNEILKGIEEREFFDSIVDMSYAMLEQAVHDYEYFTDPNLKESARRNVAYFAVALKLLQTPTEGYNGSEEIKVINFSIPEYVIEDVNKELENIAQHDGFHPSAIFNSNPNCICDYPCCYCEDYSQYVPRGHYTRSEQLKRYFKAMMWYGRIAFMLKGCNGDEALISKDDAHLSTIQAALIASELPDVRVNNSTAQEIWDRIYAVTAFFVGTADDLTPYEYHNAITNVFGTAYNARDLSDGDKLLELKVELAMMRSPEIYGGSGICVVYPPITEEKLYVCLNETKGMRFMGQRFVPDSYMFDQLVSPAVGMYTGNGTPFTMCYTPAGPARCLPRGLDIMSVLGSDRAGAILIADGDTEYAGLNTSYAKQLNELQSEFAAFNSSDWNRNLYWSWLYTLKPLLTTFGDGYPKFMQTMAWQDKELQTALASWTELRHDTILYGKQSYTPVLRGMPQPPKPVVGYVEPVPKFYARLLALTKMTEQGLVDLDVLNDTEKARLQSLESILERLIEMSKAELENETLTELDYEFIRNFGERLDSVVTGVAAKGKETTIVADVHTDCNTKMVLEEGVGYVDLILVAYIVPDGRLIVGAGPVLSYYEFKQPMDDRLTDEKWKEILETEPPEKPGWVDWIGG